MIGIVHYGNRNLYGLGRVGTYRGRYLPSKCRWILLAIKIYILPCIKCESWEEN